MLLLELCLIVVMALHLICVNVSSAGPLVCLWLEWREGRGDELAGRVGRYLANVSLWLLIVGSVLGLVVGYILWSPQFRTALERLSSRIVFGVWEMVFSLVCLALYALWWRAAPKCGPGQRGVRMVLPFLAATNLLYHFPFLFAIISQLTTSRQTSAEPIEPEQFRALMADGEVVARTVHFWLASLAVTGMVLIGYALRISRRSEAQGDSSRVAVWGGRITLIPTLLQIPAGIWLLLQLPAESSNRLLGADAIGTVLLAFSLVMALSLMHQLAAIALGDTRRKVLVRAMLVLMVVVLLMTGTLRRSRSTIPARNTLTFSHFSAR